MNKHDKTIALRTLINVILRDLGLRNNDVTYNFKTNLDTVTAFTGNKQVFVQFGDNLDAIDELTIACYTDVIYKCENVSMREVFDSKIVDAISMYDFGDYDE